MLSATWGVFSLVAVGIVWVGVSVVNSSLVQPSTTLSVAGSGGQTVTRVDVIHSPSLLDSVRADPDRDAESGPGPAESAASTRQVDSRQRRARGSRRVTDQTQTPVGSTLAAFDDRVIRVTGADSARDPGPGDESGNETGEPGQVADELAGGDQALASPQATATPDPSPTPTATVAADPLMATPTPSPTPTAESSSSPTPEATATGTPTQTPQPGATSTAGPTSAPTAGPSATATPASSATPVPAASPSLTATTTPQAPVEPSATATARPTTTAEPGPTASATPLPTATSTPLPIVTPTPLPAATSTPAPTPTPDFEVRTVSSIGGVAAIRFNSSNTVTLMWATPRTGFTVEVERIGRRIEIDFQNGDHESLITAWWSNGPRVAVEEEPKSVTG